MIIIENINEYKDTKLTIPVGIGVVQTEAEKNFYNTSDAGDNTNEILKDKVYYGRYGKLVGTLDLEAEKNESYDIGYQTGHNDGSEEGYEMGFNNGREFQKEWMQSITITENGTYTREDGWNEVTVEVQDLNGSYDEGYTDGETAGYQDGYAEGLDDGIIDGREQIIEEQSDANITANDVTKGKIGYGANNEKIVGTSEVLTSIDVVASGIKFGYSTFAEIPSYYNFDNCTDMSYMFYNSKLTSVPNFDTSIVTDMGYMFAYCSNLTSVPLFDTSNVTNMASMFSNCNKIASVHEFNTSKVTNMASMFSNCNKLTSVPEFNGGGITGGGYNCTQLFGSTNYVENFGGLKDLGKGYNKTNSTYKNFLLQSQAKLTYESCMNVINKVYDMSLNTENTYAPKIRFHATPFALLSADDIAIATAKGWSVQAG